MPRVRTRAGISGRARHEGAEIRGPVAPTEQARTVERPLGGRAVQLTGGPLARWQEVNRTTSFRLGIERLESEGNLHNLRMAGGEATGEFRTPLFMDGAVHKLLDAAAWELGREPDERLARFVDETTDLLARVQQDDGYLNSYYQAVRPGDRYTQLDRSHEIYLAGLLILAGIAEQRAGRTGRLLFIARMFADHLVARADGDREEDDTGPDFDGHPGAEFAFVELYRHTGDSAYLELASKMIEDRGRGLLGTGHGGSRYFQDHLPVREAATVVGHAVRAMYLETGIVDLYLETGDRTLLDASVRRWEDMVATKLSLTGGIGSRHRGEAFGDAYELPPDRAYNESCAAFAGIFWNWRLLLATGEARYADLLERMLYNAFAASTSIDGSTFFYVNPLQRREDHYEGDDPGRRHEWYACPCCPPNIMRLVSSFGHYLATTNETGVSVHQYAAGRVFAEVDGAPVGLTVDTDYPWSGTIALEVTTSPGTEWTLSLRLPGWCETARLSVAGEWVPVRPDAKGYLRVRRRWQAGEEVRLELEMPARLTYPHPRIDALRGCVAVERGPLVYCFEQVDQPAGADLSDLSLDTSAGMRVVDQVRHPELGRTVTIEASGVLAVPGTDQPAYGSTPPRPTETRPVVLTAVPYFQWDNRGRGGMRVWLPAR